jgi:VanZ family protein
MIRARIPGLICVLVLIGILVAGLAPFGRPRNAVAWLGNEDGVRLGNHGTMWSSGTFRMAVLQGQPSCSLEIWLQPGSTSASGTILSFYVPGNPRQFLLQQYHSLLILDREIGDEHDRTQTIGVEGVFRQIEPVFITITSGTEETSMYVNGTLARSFPQVLIGKECGGQLVIGTSPIRKTSWSGQLKGLAIYRRELTPAQVLQHYQTWTSQGRPELSGNEMAIAVYLLDERAGIVVHNAVRSGTDLYIPERYSLVHQEFLEPFWKEFKPELSYCIDTLINILGFIPLGFFFCYYWSSIRSVKHAALTTVIFGFTVSLTIEVLQSYLPTRDSGTTDLITNTFGTFIGVKLCASRAGQAFLAKVF